MKKQYEKPQIEILQFEIEEDIAAGIGSSGTTIMMDPFGQ